MLPFFFPQHWIAARANVVEFMMQVWIVKHIRSLRERSSGRVKFLNAMRGFVTVWIFVTHAVVWRQSLRPVTHAVEVLLNVFYFFTSEWAIFRAARFSRTICARLERFFRAKSCRRVKDLDSRLVQELVWRRVKNLVSRGKLNGREDDWRAEDLLCRRGEVLASEATFKWRLDDLVLWEEFDIWKF